MKGLARWIAAGFLLAVAVPLPGASCVACHRDRTPAAVRQWRASAHARAGIGCEACHGRDHGRLDRGEVRVDAKVCGRCHSRALREHQASRHGMALRTGWGCLRNQPGRDPGTCRTCHEPGSDAPTSGVACARFLKQSSSMQAIGCNACHQVETSCAACHTDHGTDLKVVRNPNVCATCHMGPDHPQWEMWQTSRHGTLYASEGGKAAPDCQACHMPKGTHDVSGGLTLTAAGDPLPPERRAAGRAEMQRRCGACHSPAFVTRELDRDDAVQAESRALVKEAEDLVGDLADHGLLDPMPEQRPPHPLRGSTLVLDGQMLYEDTSHIERLLFKMKKYDYAKTVKGAFHQNPAYAHWYGNAELKMDLVDIRAEASRLRERGKLLHLPGADPATASVEERLRALKAKADRGALSPEAYREARTRLLEGTSKEQVR
ncbi:MAG TPA: multiheme c-type cytochrome [Holophagaceae bacterium]